MLVTQLDMLIARQIMYSCAKVPLDRKMCCPAMQSLCHLAEGQNRQAAGQEAHYQCYDLTYIDRSVLFKVHGETVDL